MKIGIIILLCVTSLTLISQVNNEVQSKITFNPFFQFGKSYSNYQPYYQEAKVMTGFGLKIYYKIKEIELISGGEVQSYGYNYTYTPDFIYEYQDNELVQLKNTTGYREERIAKISIVSVPIGLAFKVLNTEKHCVKTELGVNNNIYGLYGNQFNYQLGTFYSVNYSRNISKEQKIQIGPRLDLLHAVQKDITNIGSLEYIKPSISVGILF